MLPRAPGGDHERRRLLGRMAAVLSWGEEDPAEIERFRAELRAARAGGLVLGEIAAHVRSGHNLAFETTSSGRGYGRLRAAGRTGTRIC